MYQCTPERCFGELSHLKGINILQIILVAPVKTILNQVKLRLPWFRPTIWFTIFFLSSEYLHLTRTIPRWTVSDLWVSTNLSQLIFLFSAGGWVQSDTSLKFSHPWKTLPDFKLCHKHYEGAGGFVCIAYICAVSCGYMWRGVHVCGGQRANTEVLPQVLSTFLLRQGPLLAAGEPGGICLECPHTAFRKVCMRILLAGISVH